MKRYIKSTVVAYQTLWDWIKDYQGDPNSELNIVDVRSSLDGEAQQLICNNQTFRSFTKDSSFMQKGQRFRELESAGKHYDVMKVAYNPDLDRYYIEVEYND